MKKLKSILLITLAVALCAASMSGCGLLRSLFYRPTPTTTVPVETIAVQTTEETTAEPETEEPSTEAPSTAAQPDTQAPQSSASNAESFNGAVLIDGTTYHDSYLGITFTVPEWTGKVYAKSSINSGTYSLAFYEVENYRWGSEKGWDGMGMLFTVMTSDTESTGDHIDYPAGSVVIDGSKKYLTYFKPTDVRFNGEDSAMADKYQSVYQYQRDYFLSGVVDADKSYSPSSNANALNLK